MIYTITEQEEQEAMALLDKIMEMAKIDSQVKRLDEALVEPNIIDFIDNDDYDEEPPTLRSF